MTIGHLREVIEELPDEAELKIVYMNPIKEETAYTKIGPSLIYNKDNKYTGNPEDMGLLIRLFFDKYSMIKKDE